MRLRDGVYEAPHTVARHTVGLQKLVATFFERCAMGRRMRFKQAKAYVPVFA